MKKEKWFLLSSGMLLGILAVLFVFGDGEKDISTATSIIAAYVVVVYLRLKRPERYLKDERTMRLSGYAVSWSWFITLIAVLVMYWGEYLKFVDLTSNQVILTVFLVMVTSITLFRWYFMRKGDV